MSSVLNVSNASGKSEEYSIKDIEMLVDSKEKNWFKWAQVGKFLGLKHIDTSIEGLDKYEMLAKNDIRQPPMSRGVGLDLSIIKTRLKNSSQPLGPCMSL